MTHHDYIIVGCGSAGSVMANRLSADGKHSVLVLEAGGTDRRFHVQLPLGYGKTYYDARVNWKYLTDPVPGLGNRASYWPRGKVLGGSSSINAMVYVRGHPNDYDDWARGAPGWSWDDVQPVFRAMERWSGAACDHRGTNGPVPVREIGDDAHPLCERFLTGATTHGFTRCKDYNGADMDGVGQYQITVDKGLRASASRCYLKPALSRANLTLKTGAHVLRIELDGQVATGVTYHWRGKRHTANARLGIVLCGGAINSPQLLELSGIGSARRLKALGLPVIKDMPAVGEHLQDHLGADLVCRTSVPSLNQSLGSWHGRMKAGLQFLLQRRGPLTLSLNQAGGFIRSRPGLDQPDLQLYFSPVSYTRAPPGIRPLIRPDPFPGFLLGFNPCKPTSTGHVHLRTPDPFDAPAIQPDYLSTGHDQRLMVRGMHLMRALSETTALRSVIEEEILPGRATASDAELLDVVRAQAWTVFHPCGTCRMDSNPHNAVVDERLRVHGIANLRVADASIFPDIPTGNTNAPAMMVGERGAAMILADDAGRH